MQWEITNIQILYNKPNTYFSTTSLMPVTKNPPLKNTSGGMAIINNGHDIKKDTKKLLAGTSERRAVMQMNAQTRRLILILILIHQDNLAALMQQM